MHVFMLASVLLEWNVGNVYEFEPKSWLPWSFKTIAKTTKRSFWTYTTTTMVFIFVKMYMSNIYMMIMMTMNWTMKYMRWILLHGPIWRRGVWKWGMWQWGLYHLVCNNVLINFYPIILSLCLPKSSKCVIHFFNTWRIRPWFIGCE